MLIHVFKQPTIAATISKTIIIIIIAQQLNMYDI